MLSLTTDLPEIEFAPGEVVIAEATRTGAIWILVSGAVTVRRGAEPISVLSRPGTVLGEISLLLDQPHGATVEAAEQAVLRFAADGAALLERHASFSRLVATDLARRLDALSVYLADIQRQYDGAPGLRMVSDVLRHLSSQAPQATRPVSVRDPDPEY